MIDYREVNKRLVLEIRKILNDDTIQIINGVDLHKIPEHLLKFPRIILEVVHYNDSEYDYVNKDGYNPETDSFEFEFEKIPTLTYRIRIYNDKHNDIDIFKLLHKIHLYYSNPYQTKLKGDIQVINTGIITDISSGINYDYVKGFQFTMDFQMSEITKMEFDYADKFGVDIKTKDIDGNNISDEHIDIP